MSLNKLDIKQRILNEKNWTLFLDRDGVINRRIVGDYVKKIEEFEFLPGVLECIQFCTNVFQRIFVVTNQQGIGKGLMNVSDLNLVHNHMLTQIEKAGGKLDSIYFSPFLAAEKNQMRKPEIGMALKAKQDFDDVDFYRSIMIGDSLSDMKFGKKAGMLTFFTLPLEVNEEILEHTDFVVDGLAGFKDWLLK